MLMSACQSNDPVSVLEGGYTYKVSGVVSIIYPDTIIDVHLTPETGTMVLTRSNEENEVTMNFNQNSGDVFDISATVSNDSLFLNTAGRYLDVKVATDTVLLGAAVLEHNEIFNVTVNGEGTRLNNDDLCLYLTYTGTARNDAGIRISGYNIHMHCKRNAH